MARKQPLARIKDFRRLMAAMDMYLAACNEEENEGRVDPPDMFFDTVQRRGGLALILDGDTAAARVRRETGFYELEAARIATRLADSLREKTRFQSDQKRIES